MFIYGNIILRDATRPFVALVLPVSNLANVRSGEHLLLAPLV